MDSTFSGSKPLELSQMGFAEGTKKGWNIYNLIVFADIADCVCNIVGRKSAGIALFIRRFSSFVSTKFARRHNSTRQNSIRDTTV